MKFLIIPILLISLISCGKHRMRQKHPGGDEMNTVNLVKNEVNVDILHKVSVKFISGVKSKRNIQPICRGINGCLHICEYLDNGRCKQLSVNQVVLFWLNKISEYTSWEQAHNDLNLIATAPDISSFLQNVDKDNRIVQSLFSLSTSANCPVGNSQNIFFSYSPHASLYLGSPIQSSEASSAKDVGDASVPVSIGSVNSVVNVSKEASSGVAFLVDEANAEAAKEAEAVAKEGVEAATAEEGAKEAEAVAEEGAEATTATEEGAKEAETVAAEEGAEATTATEEGAKEAEAVAAEEGAEATTATEEGAKEAEAVAAEEGVEAATAEEGAKDNVNNFVAMSKPKKIIDSLDVPFNLPIFIGFIKQCFGYNTRTFSEMAIQIENKKAFEIGHQVISKACGENDTCIRLAYCAIDSNLVQVQLKKEMKKLGCEYNSFVELLP